MADGVPDPGDDWRVKAIYQLRLLVKDSLPLLAILATGGYTAVQSYRNADHTIDAKNTIVTSHNETVAKVDDAASKAADVKTTLTEKTEKTDAKLEELNRKVTALPPAVASAVQKEKGK